MSNINIAPTSLVARKPDLIAADIDGDVVMMGIDQGEYYGITGVGSRVWDLLDTPITIEAIIRTICQEYETDEDTCRADMTTFISELVNLELVSVINEKTTNNF